MEKQRIAGVRHLVTVASGKGGVGKSTVSVNLAVAFAQLGWRVGLFDADVHGPNVPLMLGVHRSAPGSGFVTAARLGGTRPEDRIQPLERYGVRVMSIGLIMGEEQPVLPDTRMVGHIVRQLLADVNWESLDILLLDLPPGTGEPLMTVVQSYALDGTIIVTTPQDVSLMDSTRTLGMFRQYGVPVLGVVENMSYFLCPNCGTQVPVFHRSERNWSLRSPDIPLLGQLPLDYSISEAGDTGRPVPVTAPNGVQAMAIRAVAQALIDRLQTNG